MPRESFKWVMAGSGLSSDVSTLRWRRRRARSPPPLGCPSCVAGAGAAHTTGRRAGATGTWASALERWWWCPIWQWSSWNGQAVNIAMGLASVLFLQAPWVAAIRNTAAAVTLDTPSMHSPRRHRRPDAHPRRPPTVAAAARRAP